MTQDERWLARYNEVMGFLEERVEPFKRLLALMEENKHVNQWV